MKSIVARAASTQGPLPPALPFQEDVLRTSPRIQSPVTRPRGSWHLAGSPSQGALSSSNAGQKNQVWGFGSASSWQGNLVISLLGICTNGLVKLT